MTNAKEHAKHADAVQTRQKWNPERPHGWVQWKGTSVCMDLRCVCGELGHVDAEFTYYIRCQKCGRTYHVNPHVELVELTPDETSYAESCACGVIEAK